MAVCLFNAKPLSKPVLGYCSVEAWEQIIIQENVFENVVCNMAAIFLGPNELIMITFGFCRSRSSDSNHTESS